LATVEPERIIETSCRRNSVGYFCCPMFRPFPTSWQDSTKPGQLHSLHFPAVECRAGALHAGAGRSTAGKEKEEEEEEERKEKERVLPSYFFLVPSSTTWWSVVTSGSYESVSRNRFWCTAIPTFENKMADASVFGSTSSRNSLVLRWP